MENSLLKFRDYDNYRFDIWNQKVYTFKFWQSKLNEEDCLKIQEKYLTENYSYYQLAKSFNTSTSTINKIIKTNKKDFWVKKNLTLDKRSKYYRVSLFRNNIERQYFVHRIICELVYGPCPEGMECCHNDGNPLNNNPDNLRWDTRTGNMADKVLHGTDNRGEKCYKAKLKTDEVIMIKNLCKYCTHQEIANIYHLCRSSIGKIINNINWKHV